MLIVDDKRLPAGMTYETAISLLDPSDDELVVHIRREIGPPEPQATAALVQARHSTPGVSSRVVADAPDSHSDERLVQEQVAGAGPVQAPEGVIVLRTGEPEPVLPQGSRHAEPAFSPQDEGHVIGRRSGPVGYTLDEVQEMAKQQRLQLVFTGSVYVLSGVLGGQKFYRSLAEVVGGLLHGRW